MTHARIPVHWPVGPSTPNLGPAEIHVWATRLDRPTQYFEPLLASDEIERANRFKFPHLRQHFVAARGVLRRLLASYLAIDAAKIQFEYGVQGKPRLSPAAEIHFNLAHSGGLALVAVARQELGVDVERVRPLQDHKQIARRFFSGAEVGQLNAIPSAGKMLGFFNCWTRKEAFLKATGDGLSRPLDSFSVSLRPGEPARFLSIADGDVNQWQLLPLEPAPDFVGAVAIKRQNWRLSCWEWTGDS